MHVLIVDDEPIIRKGLVRMLEQYPDTVSSIRTANHGYHALEIIRQQSTDIVFTDIRMPRMDGLELCREIHEQYDYIETVVISGYDDFAYVQKCMGYGVKHYLLKPVTTPDMHDVLDQIMKKRGKGYVSLSKVDLWIDKFEQAISLLQHNERLMQEWKQYCTASGMNLSRLTDFLRECIEMLSKRLSLHTASRFSDQEPVRFITKEDALAAFDNRLKQMITHMIEQRSGIIKNPLQEAKAYIDSHLAEEITLEEVAEMVGLTPNYFSSIFKKMTNETFVQYRIKKRIERALTLLAVPNIKIVDVAAEVGYEDYPHFTKMFKKMTGYSPSEYRIMLGIK